MGLQPIHIYWRQLAANVSNTLNDLHKNDALADVTIVSDDGVMFAAHKGILSSSSSILKATLPNNTDVHPTILMRDVNEQDLSAILQFIYLGEVRVHGKNIGSFLAIGKALQITDISIINEVILKNETRISNESPNKNATNPYENAVTKEDTEDDITEEDNEGPILEEENKYVNSLDIDNSVDQENIISEGH